jgi:hypothetical protein
MSDFITIKVSRFAADAILSAINIKLINLQYVRTSCLMNNYLHGANVVTLELIELEKVRKDLMTKIF